MAVGLLPERGVACRVAYERANARVSALVLGTRDMAKEVRKCKRAHIICIGNDRTGFVGVA